MAWDIWVDFNDVATNGVVQTLVKFAVRPLDIGEHIYAGDDDGNICEATVISVDGGLVALALDLGTFQDCGHPTAMAV